MKNIPCIASLDSPQQLAEHHAAFISSKFAIGWEHGHMHTQRKNINFPLLVTASTIDDLEKLSDSVVRVIEQSTAGEFGLTSDQIIGLKSDGEVVGLDRYREIEARSELKRYSIPDLEVTFQNGVTNEEATFLDIRERISAQSSSVTRISVRIGKTSKLHLNIALEKLGSTAGNIKTQGDALLARTTFEDALRRLENHEAPDAWLRKGWNQYGIVAGIGTISIVFYLIILSKIMLPKDSWILFFVSLSPLVIIPITGILAGYMLFKMDRLFPILEFRFGREFTRAASKRRALLQLIAILIAPSLFLGISTILNAK